MMRLRRNPDLVWIWGSLVAGLIIVALAVWPAFAQSSPRNCVDLTGQINRAAMLAQQLRAQARVDIVAHDDGRERVLLESASALGALAAQAVLASACFKGAAQ